MRKKRPFYSSPTFSLLLLLLLLLSLLFCLRPLKQRSSAMETFYISHGSPMLPIEKDAPARDFLLQWTTFLPQRPRAILAISAHWDTNHPTLNTGSQHSTIHDFGGFPPELYRLQYNAPGSPDLARKVKTLLTDAGFKTIFEDPKRGLDHGAWVPLYLMYPEADIPVCQLSIQSHKDASYHYRMGQALSPLREEGILIMGSGSAIHNLRTLSFDNRPPHSWALAFDQWLNDTLSHGRIDDLIDCEHKAPFFRKAHPTPDHFYPLFVALGAAGPSPKSERIHSSWMCGSLSMASFAFKRVV